MGERCPRKTMNRWSKPPLSPDNELDAGDRMGYPHQHQEALQGDAPWEATKGQRIAVVDRLGG
jgi:hypothetical protein